MSDSRVIATIWRELCDADATGYKRVVHIRVTPDAIPGSPVSVPVTPERARAIGRLVALEDGVVADPDWYERALEMVLHPKDYAAVLREGRLGAGLHCEVVQVGEITRILGVPVTR